MDHQQVISMRMIVTIVCLGFALPLKAQDKAMDLRQEIPTLQNEEKPKFIDRVWQKKDYELVGYVLKEGDADLLKYFKIKLGNAPGDEFKNKVSVLCLRAPENFWNGSPPSSGSGIIDFAARREILNTLVSNLENDVSLEDLNSREERLNLAAKLEKSLGLQLPKIFPKERIDSNRESRGSIQESDLDDRRNREPSSRSNEKSQNQGETLESKKSNLSWIIAGVLLVGILAFLLRKIYKGKSAP